MVASEMGSLRAAFVDEFQGVAVAAHFLLVAVAQRGLAEHERADARLVHLDAFDAVGGNGAFDERVFAQHLELLRRLAGEQFLFAARLGQIGQIPRRPRGQRGRFGGELAEGHHSLSSARSVGALANGV